eukprot:175561_1
MTEFGCCDILECLFSTRHHSDDKKEKVDDELVQFYAQSMDSLHFYLLHLYQCGLRTEKPNEDENNEIKNDDANNDKNFDHEFSRISRLILERQHSATFNRFKNNNKFSLFSQNEEQDDSKTFTDEMYSYFSRIEEISTDIISKFVTFMVAEQYDSDSLKMDVDSLSEGNIASNVNDKQLIEAVKDFINATKLKSTSFNIGVILYYWPKYKEMKEFNQNGNKYNINDHGGYKFADLYVEQKFSSFKEEISYYKHFSMVQYKDLVVKINEYLKAEITKTIKARQGGIKLEYGVEEDTTLSFHHLLSILLYTDYSELCTDFSSSFRSAYPFEPVSSIKKRNQTYWWMAKGLREAVQ